MNNTGTFLLGVIAAIVLILLWKKESRNSISLPGSAGAGAGSGASAGGCGGSCGGGCGGYGGTCDTTSPLAQGLMAMAGLDGMISPGTPPLNTVAGGQGATSYYSSAGVTSDASFTFLPTQRNLSSVGSPVQPAQPNVAGSSTTPAAVTPIRATQQVPSYSEQGFVQRHNIAGIPLTAGSRLIQ